jgi:hypothetical protein
MFFVHYALFIVVLCLSFSFLLDFHKENESVCMCVCVSFFFSNVLSAYYCRYKLSLSLFFSTCTNNTNNKTKWSNERRKFSLRNLVPNHVILSLEFCNEYHLLRMKKRKRVDGKRTNKRSGFHHFSF